MPYGSSAVHGLGKELDGFAFNEQEGNATVLVAKVLAQMEEGLTQAVMGPGVGPFSPEQSRR